MPTASPISSITDRWQSLSSGTKRVLGGGVALVAVAVIAFVLLGPEPSDSEQIEEVMNAYNDAVAAGDGETACEQLAPEYAAKIMTNEFPGDCADRHEALSATSGEEGRRVFAETVVTDLDLNKDGDKALVRVRGPDIGPDFQSNAAYNMVQVDGDWKIGSLNEIETEFGSP